MSKSQGAKFRFENAWYFFLPRHFLARKPPSGFADVKENIQREREND